MIRAALRPAIVACAVPALLAMPSPADTVVVRGQPPFTAVRLIHCAAGRLAFVGRSQRLVRVPLAQVERVEPDAHPDFTAAEQALHRWPRRAAAALDALLGNRHTPAWLRTLARIRRIEARQRCGRFADAIRDLVTLAATDPASAAIVHLHEPPAPGSPQLDRAIRTLRSALSTRLDRDARRRLRTLWLELLLIDDRPLPPGLAARPPRGPDIRPTDKDAPPRLFADAARLASPGGSARVTLPADSLVLEAILQQARRGHCRTARRILRAALPYAEPTAAAAWRIADIFVRGCCEDAASAAMQLEQQAAEAPDAALAARAWRLAADCWQRAGRDDLARAARQRAAARIQPDPPARPGPARPLPAGRDGARP